MPPKDPKSDLPAHLLAELLELRPDIERILADEPRSSRRFCPNLEDKVQTVLLKVLRHLPGYRPHEDGLKPWLTRITFNLKHDAHRSKQRRSETFGDEHVDADLAPSAGISPERAAQTRSLLRKVFAAIAEMPASLQEVLVLSAFAGMSHSEIASKLDITEDAVKMRLLRAREHLRKKVGRIDDHIGVIPVIRFLARRTMTFLGQVVHLLPPIFIGICTLPQWESSAPLAQSEKTVVLGAVNAPRTSPLEESRPTVPVILNVKSVADPLRETTPNVIHRPKLHKPRADRRMRNSAPVEIYTDSTDFFVGDGS